MAGVVGRFRSAAGVPLVGFVRLTPAGGAVSAGGESVAGPFRVSAYRHSCPLTC